jgi:catechol 2,3-dioxygenase-like lactoylglutathione lyase family enzyme
MATALHHLAFTAADLTKNGPAYDAVFAPLGYHREYDSGELITWTGTGPELLLYAVEGDDVTPHQHGDPGLQHVAFAVDDRATVEAVHTAAVDNGWTIVHPPREYDYTPGYFAVFITDTAGNRLEIAHIPAT